MKLSSIFRRLVHGCLFALSAQLWADAPINATAPTARPANSLVPNVLLIIADDLNTSLGCYGHPLARTPNIDRLAGRGVLFTRAYCNNPICHASRVSMLTGRLPAYTGITSNDGNFREYLPNAVTLPECFRLSGYETACAGKVYHEIQTKSPEWSIDTNDLRPYPKHVLLPRREELAGVIGTDGWDFAAKSVKQDLYSLERARQVFHQKLDKPLFLAVGFVSPHIPLASPKRFMEPFLSDEFMGRIVLPPDFSSRPNLTNASVALQKRPLTQPIGNRVCSPDEARTVTGAYLGSVSFLDHLVGELLQELENSGRMDDTIVVFMGDHGWHLGEKGLWGKATPYEPALRTPLIVSIPPGLQKQRNFPVSTCTKVVSLVDVYPTLAELCQLEARTPLDGRSLVPLLENASQDWPYVASAAVLHQAGRTIRNERYRYTEWDGEPLSTELFDYASDPTEQSNVASNPAYDDIRRKMARMIRELRLRESLAPHAWRLQQSSGSEAILSIRQPSDPILDISVQRLTMGPIWQVNLARRIPTLRSGHRYLITFTAKADRPVEMTIEVTQDSPPFQSLGLKRRVPLSTQPTEWKFEFVAEKNVDWAKLRFDLGTAPARTELREFRFTEIDAQP